MTTQNLSRLRKDTLIEMLKEATQQTTEMSEKLPAAAVIGGATGFILGLALAAM